MDDSLTSTAEKYKAAEEKIAQAVSRSGRAPGSARLVAVTKTVDPEKIEEAYNAGARLFGESYVQEALTKIDCLPADAQWHMLGRLQTNKVKRALDMFTTVQSLDRPSLADELQKTAQSRGISVDVFLQVNLAAETSKSGAAADEAVLLAKRAGEWPNLKIKGLMAIPPWSPDPEFSRPYFRQLRELRDKIASMNIERVEMAELSMGMSNDFEVAVEEGATLVRVGTAIFGERH